MSEDTYRIQMKSVPWHAEPEEEVRGHLEVDPGDGLSPGDVSARLEQFGPNALQEVKPPSALTTLVRQLKSVVVLLLAGAALVSLFVGEGDWLEFGAIMVVILLNTLIGFFTERKAQKEMAALRKLTEVRCRVRRDGRVQEVAAQDVVPGDVLLVEAGDLVAADARLFATTNLSMVESSLTGESLPVEKGNDRIPEETVLAERTNMIYKGTAVAAGRGEAVVVATGLRTEIGRISALVERASGARTPLEERLESLGHQLLWITLGIAAIVIVTGILRSRDVWEMVKTGVALAVAAIPEGLPVVATIALARGMWRMARQNALINHLAAVETLGSTTVICVDKTGTMTENRMTVVEMSLGDRVIELAGAGLAMEGEFSEGGRALEPREDPHLEQALGVGVLCNKADIRRSESDDGEWDAVGDPLEVAFLVAAAKAGIRREEAVGKFPEEVEFPFDSDIKMMATLHRAGDGKYLYAIKGAPERVMDACDRMFTRTGVKEFGDEARRRMLKRNEELGVRGLRVIGLACKESADPEEDPYRGLIFLGLAAEDAEAERRTRRAGASRDRSGVQGKRRRGGGSLPGTDLSGSRGAGGPAAAGGPGGGARLPVGRNPGGHGDGRPGGHGAEHRPTGWDPRRGSGWFRTDRRGAREDGER